MSSAKETQTSERDALEAAPFDPNELYALPIMTTSAMISSVRPLQSSRNEAERLQSILDKALAIVEFDAVEGILNNTSSGFNKE
eukprot:CAMPEP_0116130926 /NCGR_PEP_ID=MMETSP0329-20121206/8735_1 /TAXON_ID=697910 /ORGANISM="Pseudo-nitzschia arenysensis, Strain B593" /LENGTH=83 /DNA_ID=CAMNT_0003625327 /DNA_START=639 /DNA_END=890 /DNA_ORIENTATION=-